MLAQSQANCNSLQGQVASVWLGLTVLQRSHLKVYSLMCHHKWLFATTALSLVVWNWQTALTFPLCVQNSFWRPCIELCMSQRWAKMRLKTVTHCCRLRGYWVQKLKMFFRQTDHSLAWISRLCINGTFASENCTVQGTEKHDPLCLLVLFDVFMRCQEISGGLETSSLGDLGHRLQMQEHVWKLQKI